ncbi:MAG: hypothetical protein ACRD6W_11795, partial [Nitrososphaerales archaeon]
MESRSEGDGQLVLVDVTAIPPEPPPELFYSHKPSVLRSISTVWRRKDVMYTLAERDIRVSYKQQFFG